MIRSNGRYSVDVAPNGAIKVRPGDWLSKYSAAFLGLPIAFAHLLSPDRPSRARPWSAWVRWTLIGLVPLVVAIVTFLILDPMVIRFFDRFREDVRM